MSKIYPVFILFSFVGLSSCISTFGFQTAKVLDEDEYQLVWEGDAAGVYRAKPVSEAGPLTLVGNPFVGFASRFGTGAKRMDWGFQMSPQSPLGFDVKYQFLGNRKSFFAAATGLGTGWTPAWAAFMRSREPALDRQNLFNLTAPLLLTFDFDDKAAVTLIGNYRYYFNSLLSFHAAIIHLSTRFRTVTGEGFKRYFTVEFHAGRSFAGTYRFDNLYFYGIALGFQGFRKMDTGKDHRGPQRRKKKTHKVFFEY